MSSLIRIYLSKLILMAISFATSVIIARALGPEGTGYFALTMTSGVLLASLLSLGVESSLLYFSGKNKDYSVFLSALALAYICAAALVVLILHYMLPTASWLSGFLSPPVVAIMIACMLQSFLLAIKIGQGFFLRINSWLILVSLIYMSLVCLYGAYYQLTYRAVLAIYVAVFVLFGVIGILRGLTNREGKAVCIKIPEFFSYSFRSFSGGLAGVLRLRLPLILVSAYALSADVGIYSVSQTFMEAFFILPVILSSMLVPLVASAPEEKRAEIAMSYAKFSLYVTSMLAAIFWVLAELIISLTYGELFYQVVEVSRVLCLGVVFYAVSKVLIAFFMGIGRPGVSSLLELFTLLVFLVLQFALAPEYGLWGVIWSVVLSLFAMLLASIMVFRGMVKADIRGIFFINGSDMIAIRRQLRSGR